MNAAVFSDDGMDLNHTDLGEFLGIGIPERIVVGKPLKQNQGPIN